jgi:GNAT superfamily N-acetyltransferase
MKSFFSAREVAAARESMGVDRSLIADGTYFVVETVQHGRAFTVGCGGWGRRKTLYGGDHTTGRDDGLSNPDTDAARIRAMYTHPDWIRLGIGTLLLELGEGAARNAGFKRSNWAQRSRVSRFTWREVIVKSAGRPSPRRMVPTTWLSKW